jgi:hypothetical protein
MDALNRAQLGKTANLSGMGEYQTLYDAMASLRDENIQLRKEISHVAHQTIDHLRDLTTRLGKLEMRAPHRPLNGPSSPSHSNNGQYASNEIKYIKDWMGRIASDLQRHFNDAKEADTELKRLRAEVCAVQAEMLSMREIHRVIMDDRADGIQVEIELDSLRHSLAARERREKTFAKQIGDIEMFQTRTQESLKSIPLQGPNRGIDAPNKAFETRFKYGSAAPLVTPIPTAYQARRELLRLYS